MHSVDVWLYEQSNHTLKNKNKILSSLDTTSHTVLTLVIPTRWHLNNLQRDFTPQHFRTSTSFLCIAIRSKARSLLITKPRSACLAELVAQLTSDSRSMMTSIRLSRIKIVPLWMWLPAACVSSILKLGMSFLTNKWFFELSVFDSALDPAYNYFWPIWDHAPPWNEYPRAPLFVVQAEKLSSESWRTSLPWSSSLIWSQWSIKNKSLD